MYNFWWKVWLSLAWLLAAGGGIDARTDSNEIKLMATGCRRVESTNQPSHHQTLAIVSIYVYRWLLPFIEWTLPPLYNHLPVVQIQNVQCGDSC